MLSPLSGALFPDPALAYSLGCHLCKTFFDFPGWASWPSWLPSTPVPSPTQAQIILFWTCLCLSLSQMVKSLRADPASTQFIVRFQLWAQRLAHGPLINTCWTNEHLSLFTTTIVAIITPTCAYLWTVYKQFSHALSHLTLHRILCSWCHCLILYSCGHWGLERCNDLPSYVSSKTVFQRRVFLTPDPAIPPPSQLRAKMLLVWKMF